MQDPFETMMLGDMYASHRGRSPRDRAINLARRDFSVKVKDNPGYVKDALRNGSPQEVLVTKTDFFYKATVTAFPGDKIYPGDIFEFYGNKWIVIETKSTNVVQEVGIAWQCNHKFRFQNYSKEIHEAWGVLDDGVYSTTRTSDSTVMSLDMQYKIYLPSNEYTDLLHQDQRLAVDQWKDKNGNDILLTYAITGRDRVTNNYEPGAHLLTLNVRATSYNPKTDNFEEMICDYIYDDGRSELPQCVIKGRNYMRIGSSRSYEVGDVTCGDEVSPLDILPIWEIEAPAGITSMENDGKIIIKVPDNISYDGSTIKLKLSDANNKYAPGELLIGVTT